MNQENLEPQDDLLRYFEKVTDKSIRTREDLDRYLSCVEEVRPQWFHVNRPARGWPLVQRIILVVLFGVALVQYVMIDVIVEIASLRQTLYFAPATTPETKPAPDKSGRA